VLTATLLLASAVRSVWACAATQRGTILWRKRCWRTVTGTTVCSVYWRHSTLIAIAITCARAARQATEGGHLGGAHCCIFLYAYLRCGRAVWRETGTEDEAVT